MRPPHDQITSRDMAPDRTPPHNYATPSLRDTAGWQELYRSMLGHITGNVELWLQGYLGDLMRSDGTPAGARPSPAAAAAASSAAAGTAIKFVIPPWLEPFQDPDNVRFTRTPDHILLREKGVWPDVANNDDALPPVESQAVEHVVEIAVDRKPFVLPPGVRNTRTPDRLLVKPAPAVFPADAEAASETPVAPAAADSLLAILTEPVEAVAVHDGAAAEQATPPVAAMSIETLVADALALARASERHEAQDDMLVEQFAGEWSDVAPQPWGDIIQLGPLEAPDVVAEQDNRPGVLLRIAEPAAPDVEPAAEAIAPVPAIPSEPDAPAADIVAAEAVAAEVIPGDAVVADVLAEVIAAEIAPAAQIDSAPEPVVATVSDEPAVAAVAVSPSRPKAEPAPVAVVEPVRPAIAAENALHMAFLGGLTPGQPARRPRVSGVYEKPELELLSEPARQTGTTLTRDALEQHARLLEGVLEDFGIRGEIINVRPGPVVTLYELEPAPGVKSSRVVGLADDIARSMSAVSARVAVVQGRNVIGIELPNERRDMVYLRELFAQPDFDTSSHKLAIALGKTIGGEPVIVDLARMPHLLVAGTTGSGKSVAINTMILSLLYRLKPEECRLIMVDPKMLELSIYDGIPHLLTPVVTDPKKAVIALKWAVREMEDRYKKMAKVGVRNIDGFNARVSEAKAKGETIVRTVHTGFDRNTGQATYASEEMDLSTLPYIVVIVDEMADLMMVAGKDIEGAIQRLAQMARAAGIHLIMATQRPSVDVITGTIKANFPTRISFQVTSKIDSRTILGEQGAEQLLGQGDMLYMAGGGRISRVHGPFVSDQEVELVVNHLKAQGQPDYLDVTTEDGDAAPEANASEEAGEDSAVFDRTGMGAGGGTDDSDLYDQAVKIVLRDKKCSTSYVQRRLSVGYNKAASLVEKMEKEGIVGAANHAGKREILMSARDLRTINITMPQDEDEDV